MGIPKQLRNTEFEFPTMKLIPDIDSFGVIEKEVSYLNESGLIFPELKFKGSACNLNDTDSNERNMFWCSPSLNEYSVDQNFVDKFNNFIRLSPVVVSGMEKPDAQIEKPKIDYTEENIKIATQSWVNDQGYFGRHHICKFKNDVLVKQFNRKSIGEGSYGVVFKHPTDDNKVLKFCAINETARNAGDAWYAYANYCISNKSPHLLCVELKCVFKNEGGMQFGLFEMDKLYELSERHPIKAILDMSTVVDKKNFFDFYKQTVEALNDWANNTKITKKQKMKRLSGRIHIISKLKSFLKEVYSIGQISKEAHMIYFDLHSSNVLMRKDGSLVITDPWCFQGHYMDYNINDDNNIISEAPIKYNECNNHPVLENNQSTGYNFKIDITPSIFLSDHFLHFNKINICNLHPV